MATETFLKVKKLPLDKRLLHRNWKVRNDAKTDLAAVNNNITDLKDPP